MTRKLRQEANGVTIPLVATNRINTPEIAEEILSKGDADLVSMARPVLADPFLLNISEKDKNAPSLMSRFKQNQLPT